MLVRQSRWHLVASRLSVIPARCSRAPPRSSLEVQRRAPVLRQRPDSPHLLWRYPVQTVWQRIQVIG
jgi:hypothetical protein